MNFLSKLCLCSSDFLVLWKLALFLKFIFRKMVHSGDTRVLSSLMLTLHCLLDLPQEAAA